MSDRTLSEREEILNRRKEKKEKMTNDSVDVLVHVSWPLQEMPMMRRKRRRRMHDRFDLHVVDNHKNMMMKDRYDEEWCALFDANDRSDDDDRDETWCVCVFVFQIFEMRAKSL